MNDITSVEDPLQLIINKINIINVIINIIFLVRKPRNYPNSLNFIYSDSWNAVFMKLEILKTINIKIRSADFCHDSHLN